MKHQQLQETPQQAQLRRRGMMATRNAALRSMQMSPLFLRPAVRTRATTSGQGTAGSGPHKQSLQHLMNTLFIRGRFKAVLAAQEGGELIVAGPSRGQAVLTYHDTKTHQLIQPKMVIHSPQSPEEQQQKLMSAFIKGRQVVLTAQQGGEPIVAGPSQEQIILSDHEVKILSGKLGPTGHPKAKQLIQSQMLTPGVGPLQRAQNASAGDIEATIPGQSIDDCGLHKQTLQQLMHTLRSPQSPEEQQRILALFKSNPQLMSAFIKGRQAVLTAQQGGEPKVAGPSQGQTIFTDHEVKILSGKLEPSGHPKAEQSIQPQMLTTMSGQGIGNSGLYKQTLQQLMHTLYSSHSPGEQQQILALLKSNPQLMSAFIKERQALLRAEQGGEPKVAEPSQCQTMLTDHKAEAQLGSSDNAMTQLNQLNHQMLTLSIGSLQETQGTSAVHTEAKELSHGTAVSGLHKQALQQLLHILHSPQSPEQHQEVLAVLKSNPQLMEAFIKRRQAVAAAQQGQESDFPGLPRF